MDIGTMNLQYYMLSAQQQYYMPIGRDYTLAFNALFDYGKSYSSNPYPIIKDIYAGGIGTVRGYSPNTLGPIDPVSGTYLGGSKRVVGNAQFYFPFPGSQKDRSLRWYAFADAGQVYGNNGYGIDQGIDLSQLRYSVGVGLSWESPMGPLQLARSMLPQLILLRTSSFKSVQASSIDKSKIARQFACLFSGTI
jgi:outer membrane protein insertion porin family